MPVLPSGSASTPSLGSTVGGTLLTVSGTGFENTVRFVCKVGSTASPSVRYFSSTRVVCQVPTAAAAGVVPVYLSNNGLDFVTSSATFTYYGVEQCSAGGG